MNTFASPAPEDSAPPLIALNATDRCDKCGAQAQAITRHDHGNLYWCQHDFNALPETVKVLKVPSVLGVGI